MGLHGEIFWLREETKRQSERVDKLEEELASLKEEVEIIRTVRLPNRKSITIPKMPMALQSIGVGLPKR